MKTDALKNPLVIGNVYGYTSTSGSIANVVTGRLVKIGEKKCTLEVMSQDRYLYGDKIDYATGSEAGKVSVSAFMLFPITSN